MKVAYGRRLRGVALAGLALALAPASLGAQPAGAPAPEPPPPGDAVVATDELDEPWTRGVPAEDRQAARALFLEGNRLFRIPLFSQAAKQYLAALARWKHPAFYFNLALAQLNLDQEVEAYESLQQALRYGEVPLGPEQYREAQHQIEELQRSLAQLRVSCQTPGAEVTLDGITLFIGPGLYQGWVKARAHELTAKKPGFLPQARRVALSAGQLQDIELKLVTLGQATDASRRWAAWKPWGLVAAGGVLAAGGGGLHALAARGFRRYDDQITLHCTAPSGTPPHVGCSPDDDPGLDTTLQTARRQQLIAVSAYVAGGALIATGVVLLYMNRPRMVEPTSSRSAAGALAVTPVVSTDMLGVMVSLRR